MAPLQTLTQSLRHERMNAHDAPALIELMRAGQVAKFDFSRFIQRRRIIDIRPEAGNA